MGGSELRSPLCHHLGLEHSRRISLIYILCGQKNIASPISKQMTLGPTSPQSPQPPPTMHTERIQDGEIQNTGPR